ncbi:hypothetical protein [Ferruginibacter albus]|uniref:hypothetical protein n=1 Tax=Ferruginibacter albus TaxID=2875540 RepID=UPI001CC5CD5A|nr:hypothetical protein [Ferruginibacter albus]UAY52394.1 hypothetical protein K9M53_01565 [Ferruginibacter albus]
MKKKKQIPGSKEDNMNALEDMHIYAAGHEVDEKLIPANDTKHVNGGIPDDEIDEDDDLDDDDNRA